MAKKKSKNKGQQPPHMSPERFMREKARTLPIGKCYAAPPTWHEAGIGHFIVTRVRPSGNLVMSVFLVDTFCLGVKNASFKDNMTPFEFEAFLKRMQNQLGVEEISYNEVHNIIYGAIAFAEEGGIEPVKEFTPARYILEEDTDEIPLIEYEFGKNGKHFLLIHDLKEKFYLQVLKKNLGDNFEFVVPAGDDEVEDYVDEEDDDHPLFSNIDLEALDRALENLKRSREESDRHPKEQYAYQYPDYPQTLSIKNQFIADELFSPDNYSALPVPVIKRILDLPKDEAAQDISNVILYVIGKTYVGINEDMIEDGNDNALIHAIILLAQIQSNKALDAVLEVMRQTGEFADYHLGDIAPEILPCALYACGKDDVAAIEAYLNQSGLDSYLRSQALHALAMIIFNQPERREEIISVFKRLLVNLVTNLPSQKACDGDFAGFVMSTLADIQATELISEIKNVFATDCVDKTIAGDCTDVINDIEHGDGGDIDIDKYQMPDIYELYEDMKSWMKKPE